MEKMLVRCCIAFIVGFIMGTGIFFLVFHTTGNGTLDEAAYLNKQATVAEQDLQRTISDLTGTIDEQRRTIDSLERRLQSVNARYSTLAFNNRNTRWILEQLVKGSGDAEGDFAEAIRIIESLLANDKSIKD